MLFNSYEFIFVFIPITLIGFHLLRGLNRVVALAWLALASLAFYAWWRPVNVLIIIPSIIVNFGLAKLLLKYADDKTKAATRTWILAAGVTANLCVLGYFKYLTFFQSTSNDLFGTDFVLTYIILPLGISFITFQKIAFLVDVHGGRIKSLKFREFALFVLFFPQLIAGPIVHYREMIAQYRDISKTIDRNMLAAGVTLFCIGLVKKVIFADGIALHVTPLYDAVAAGDAISLVMAWVAAVGFTLQIYFDFSGYSDMAAGLALAVGVRLPLNFDSPLKASNIIDFWARWHVTLTRFLTAYLYNPLSLYWTRRRLRSGRPGYSAARPNVGAFLQLLAIPTLFTMLISGLWHGAGYTYIIWGGLHGLYIVINHAWRVTVPKRFASRAKYDRLMGPLGWLVTFLSVTIAMVWFRASSPGVAVDVMSGMFGLNGIGLPEKIASIGGLNQLPFIHALAISPIDFVIIMASVGVLLFIALIMPNSLQMLASQQPVVNYRLREDFSAKLARRIDWRPSLPWFIAMSVCLYAVMMQLGGKSEFLYWQF